jgi:hypothetical protein
MWTQPLWQNGDSPPFSQFSVIEIISKGSDIQSKSFNTKCETKWKKIEFEFEKQQKIPYKKLTNCKSKFNRKKN